MDKKQQDQLKKYLVFGGLGLLFALSLWFIFAPSGKEKTAAQQGLNDSIPQATIEQLTANKLKVYEQGAKTTEDDESREELASLSEHLDESSNPEQAETTASKAKIESSMQRYAENNRLLNSFYATDPSEEERAALRSEVESLKTELSKKNDKEEDDEERQLALMEKSYQMAAKYLPKSANAETQHLSKAFAEAKERPIVSPEAESRQEESKTIEVLPEKKQLVSALHQPMSDADFIKTYGTKARNLGFHAMADKVEHPERNTISAIVDHTTVLKEGDAVVLRLLEDARIKDLLLPRQSRLIARAKIEGNRLGLTVRSIELGGRIIPVKLSAYDLEGQEGIYIPELENVSALKEMGANIGGTMGTSFTFASSAKDQIISEAARGVMQGASQLLQKKLRTIKVTLKGGYRLFFMPTK